MNRLSEWERKKLLASKAGEIQIFTEEIRMDEKQNMVKFTDAKSKGEFHE